jgi:hypothetical protein
MEETEKTEDNDDEMVDIDVTEINLDGEEIDELIQKLQELKSTKTQVSFDIDEDNELVINYEEYEDGEDGNGGAE